MDIYTTSRQLVQNIGIQTLFRLLHWFLTIMCLLFVLATFKTPALLSPLNLTLLVSAILIMLAVQLGYLTLSVLASRSATKISARLPLVELGVIIGQVFFPWLLLGCLMFRIEQLLLVGVLLIMMYFACRLIDEYVFGQKFAIYVPPE